MLGGFPITIGALAVVLGSSWNVVNLEDEGPRCLVGCASSLLQYYLNVFEASTGLIAVGVVVIAFGARLDHPKLMKAIHVGD